MLLELQIKNLALIDQLTLHFGEGLTVLTGETGAGKSIILQAIHLLSGGKASAKWVRSGTDQAVVEALFEVTDNPSLTEILAEHGYEQEEQLLIKRVVNAKGRSRFYLNSSLATAKLTSQISEQLLSVASQHDHQLLLSSPFQLHCLDGLAGLLSKRSELAAIYDSLRQTTQALAELDQDERSKEQRHDFLSFQLQEISEASLQPAEDQELEIEKNRLKSAEELASLGRKSFDELNKATQALGLVRKNLQQMANLDQQADSLADQVAEPSYILDDQLIELRHYLEGLPSDQDRLEQINQRLDLINQLKRKYGSSIDEVLDFASQASQELEQLDNQDQERERLLSQQAQLTEQYDSQASSLTKERRQQAKSLAGAINNELASLCLENGTFTIDVQQGRDGRLGRDQVDFLFSANRGEEVKPVAQIASGGELSRLLLGLKTILAQEDQVGTVIFDEVDSGISGKAAESVARKIRQLADQQQVLCITHLPQIAALADDHYLVEKKINNERTISTIALLPAEQRATALATMLDGENIGDHTMAYVAELLGRRDRKKD